MKLYGAIDLHSNNNVTVLIDEKDKVVYQKRLPNDLPFILEQLSPYALSIEGIVVESTYNWYWLVDGATKCRLMLLGRSPRKGFSVGMEQCAR
jgi:transposase